jgi:penicillin-binding protein 1C
VGARRTPLPTAPAGTRIARTGELPAALQRFRPHGLPEVASRGRGDAPLSIAFPPDGARIEVSGGAGALSLKALGGVAPFTWLADGVPVVLRETRRAAFWERPGRGFTRISVIDAKGATASANVRIE